jgi:hypothetical protein
MEPSELLKYDSRLVAFTQELPFQEGKPLSRITKEEEDSTELVEYSHTAKTLLDRQIYMASLRNVEDDELGTEYDVKLLADVSADKRMADAPQDENEEHGRIRRLKNAKQAKRRRNMENRAHNRCTVGTSTTPSQRLKIRSTALRSVPLQRQHS